VPVCELCRERPATVTLIRDERSYSACVDCAAGPCPEESWPEAPGFAWRDPGVAYAATVWAATLVLLGQELARHPQAVSLADEYRAALTWRPAVAP
jgi:hypothetical protein